jgi:integrase
VSVESLPLAEPLPAPLGQQCVESDGFAAQLGVVEGRRRRMSPATVPSLLRTVPSGPRPVLTCVDSGTSRCGRGAFAPEKKRPATLAEEFIKHMFEVTGGGHARGFEDVRDHAIFKLFTEGARRTEVAQMEVDDLSADLIARPFARVVPLKDARTYGEGRIIPFTVATGRAVAAYLRVRRSHRLAHLPALWLGTRGRGPMTGSGIYQMIKRRAEEAGYDPKEIWLHQWRDTFANDWLAGGGSEGDLMRLMGWSEKLAAPSSQPRRHKQITPGYQSTTLPFGTADSFE